MDEPEIPSYQQIRDRVAALLGTVAGSRGACAASCLFLWPDLLVLLLRVTAARDVPDAQRRAALELFTALANPPGLLIDALLTSRTSDSALRRVAYQLDEVLNQVAVIQVRRLWPGSGDALDQVQAASADLALWAREGLLPGLGRRLRQRLGWLMPAGPGSRRIAQA